MKPIRPVGIYFLSLGLLSSSFALAEEGAPSSLREQAQAVLTEARAKTLAIREDGQHWMLPSYLGSQFNSLYYLSLKWTGRLRTDFDEARFKALLLSTQGPDGSWLGVPDENRPTGILGATIANYWALKAMGNSPEEPFMAKARAWVLAQGGLAKAPSLTKVMLAAFGNESWGVVPAIPYELFFKHWIISDRALAQWIDPILIQVAYMKHLGLSRDLGPRFNLDELRAPGDRFLTSTSPRFTHQASFFRSDRDHVRRIIARQLSGGSWGGYPIASTFGVMVLDDFASRDAETAAAARQAEDRAFGSLEKTLLHSGSSAYLGAQDSRYWDTALIGGALLEAGEGGTRLSPSAHFLAETQNDNGGFPFGDGLETIPDTDDTAEVSLFLLRMKGYGPEVERAMAWLKRMQNDDGGWGAFTRNNNPNFILQKAAGSFGDSADLFDDSSPDVSGHILEAMAATGLNQSNSAEVRLGADYLRREQRKSGAWQGRWGVTYLYGTCAALVGLLKSGEDPNGSGVRKAVAWLKSKQNADGGWGETTLADSNSRLAGVGISSPTQTAWALIALLEAGAGHSPVAENGVRYLIQSFREQGAWVDRSAVGTGHPVSFYMQYPAYAHAFPAIALARFLAQ